MNKGILIFYQYGTKVGYAIKTLENTFFHMALNITRNLKHVHIGHPNFHRGRPEYLPEKFNNLLEIDTYNCSKNDLKRIFSYIKNNNIEIAFGFDQPVYTSAYKTMRQAGIRLFVSYCGAPMSSLNKGAKLAVKKLEVFLRRTKPDHYIFESQGMADTAVFGRGIPSRNVSVIPTGIDIDKYKPGLVFSDYAHREFSILPGRKIIIYTGHLEERKGVHVLINAANEIICQRGRKDVHFLLIGNREGEEIKFAPLYEKKQSEKHITFGGYQSDIPQILQSCYLGVIASTGWDSFPMSSIEMAASGLPLIVSDLPGIKETIDPGKTGFLFPVEDHFELANRIEFLVNNPEKHKQMGIAGRKRVVENYSEKKHIENLTNLVKRLAAAKNILI